jgi:Fe2+ transport system protein B
MNLLATNNKKQNVLHVAVERYAINVIPELINRIKEGKVKEILTAKDEDGKCPIHIAGMGLRQNLISILQNTAREVGIENDILDSRGLTADEVMREIEDERRAALRQIEKEKEAAKQKKADEKAAQKMKELKEKEVEKQLQEVKKLKKKQEQVIEEESKRRAPYMLLMFIAIVVLLLYLMLKIGVATGATKRAANATENEIEDLVDI